MENPFNSIENRIRHLEELLFKIIENQEAQVFEPVDKIGIAQQYWNCINLVIFVDFCGYISEYRNIH